MRDPELHSAVVGLILPEQPPDDRGTWSTVAALVLDDLREEAEEAEEARREHRIDPPPVHRIIDALEAAPLRSAGPPSVFNLAERPVAWRRVWAGPQPPATARRIERLEGGITRCINYPLTETEEWVERELQRRARQRPPRSGTRKVKEAIRHWGIFEGEAA